MLSVIAPARDEADNLPALVREITSALANLTAEHEIIIVDDASADGTASVLRQLEIEFPRLRAIRLEPPAPGRGNGQSAAFKAGIDDARGWLVAMIDADLQNDPADLPRLLAILQQREADLVQGDRSANRRDTAVRRFGSWIGRVFRRLILGDTIRDTGCSLRVMRREVAGALPLELRGMHRFIPVIARQLGYIVVETPVSHRPRTAGRTKYGNLSRALPGLIDCFIVRWMGRRRVRPESTLVEPTWVKGPTSERSESVDS